MVLELEVLPGNARRYYIGDFGGWNMLELRDDDHDDDDEECPVVFHKRTTPCIRFQAFHAPSDDQKVFLLEHWALAVVVALAVIVLVLVAVVVPVRQGSGHRGG